MTGHVFISHSSRDDAVVARIREALLASGVGVWDDARQLVAGNYLAPEIRQALEDARGVIAVLSPRTVNSTWVSREIECALEIRNQRGATYRVIPVLIDGLEPPGLRHWFAEEPVGVKVEVGPGGIQDALPALLDALGLGRTVEAPASRSIPASPIADLTLELKDPYVDRSDGKHRGAATAELVYRPAEAGAPEVRSQRFKLVAPLGPIEAEALRWYLERYVSWPSGVFQERARRIEEQLPEWGRRLHAAMLETPHAREPYEAWKRSAAARRLTVLVDRDLIASAAEGQDEKARQAEADEGATLLLGLPWELLQDEAGYLFHGPRPVRVRRRLPNRTARAALVTTAPLRVLLLSPRPEDEHATYIDHRVSARPVVEALSALGELAELTLLSPPTLAALTKELDDAQWRGQPYHIVHFDGHGVYSRRIGLGALCFERAQDGTLTERRRSDIVDATKLAEVMRDQRVPLFFLEACQTAVADKDPTASVAGTLLQGGVASVVAMSHSVLVETARRFVTEFYTTLLAGRRIGDAMVTGQRALKADTLRDHTFEGELHLDDWFVPVLYQEEEDPQLIQAVPAQRVQEVLATQHHLSLGELPPPPEHGFVGRSRELLTAERVLDNERYVVLRGEGGEGKTTLAAELARWLVATRRFERAAFAGLDKHGDARSVLFALGRQLVVGFESLAGRDEAGAWLEFERALRERRTVVVFDNLESILPPEAGAIHEGAFEPEVSEQVLNLAASLNAIGATRVVFTSRQAIPAPFATNHVRIGRLGRREAIDLVSRTLSRQSQAPRAGDPGESEDEVARLVDAVACHARSLVLLAREVAESGVRTATGRLGELMARLHERYPEDRERSLYASVELSLRRLPAGMREAIRPLGAFQGGGHMRAMNRVLTPNDDTTADMNTVVASLVRVGLADQGECGYVRLDPAIGPLLFDELSPADKASTRDRWAMAMVEMVHQLGELREGPDPRTAIPSLLVDLPNVLTALEYLGTAASAGLAVEVACTVESLLQDVGRPRAMSRASRVRTAAAGRLTEWGHARFSAERQSMEQLLGAGRFPEAIAVARRMVESARTVGDTAYPGAAFDTIEAQLQLGRALLAGGHAEDALPLLHDARERFQNLGAGGHGDASRAVSVASRLIGDCLRSLGRLDSADEAYEHALRIARTIESARQVLVVKGQIAHLRLDQRRYDDALLAFRETLSTFDELGESRSVAAAWHNIGMVHLDASQYDEAERAFLSALRISVQAIDR